jgi:hypothetical protein
MTDQSVMFIKYGFYFATSKNYGQFFMTDKELAIPGIVLPKVITETVLQT